MFRRLTLIIVLPLLFGCSLFSTEEEYLTDEGENIRFIFDEGLNDDPKFRLSKDENGFYYMELNNGGQNIQRISVRLLDGDEVVYNRWNGRRHYLEWSNNLYWWLLEGDTVANITETYFNPFTGEIQYVNLPPLINWKDVLVPTINKTSVTDEYTGRGSTVIGPIGRMKGDTMTVYVKYTHPITRYKKEGIQSFTTIGSKEIIDSVKIILK
ncbi:MAG: hypothetical protein HWE07_02595 [Cytophagia bacterium]|nr:hypothetical protein [Cytophagia bacterium]